MSKIPLSVLVATKNEIKNINTCISQLIDWADEIVFVDSGSSDGTIDVINNFGCKILQFDYKGGWPKKRQWALNEFKFKNKWLLILDCDEVLNDDIKKEIAVAVNTDFYDGYWIKFELKFLGRKLKYGLSKFYKLALFKNGLGSYENRISAQDTSMSDVEVHEHIFVKGKVGYLKTTILDDNKNSLDRFIQKHNEYSNWESKVLIAKSYGNFKPNLFGNQVQKRRYLKHILIKIPGSPIIVFCYSYFYKLGFLDGKEGFYYAVFQSIQNFNVKAKILELKKYNN